MWTSVSPWLEAYRQTFEAFINAFSTYRHGDASVYCNAWFVW